MTPSLALCLNRFVVEERSPLSLLAIETAWIINWSNYLVGDAPILQVARLRLSLGSRFNAVGCTPILTVDGASCSFIGSVDLVGGAAIDESHGFEFLYFEACVWFDALVIEVLPLQIDWEKLRSLLNWQ
jgi:hypothetical protein